MDLSEIYTEIIAEHNKSKRNKKQMENPTVILKGRNPSCGDEIELALKVEKNIIQDASFTGVGCAISQASTSMMIDLVRGQTIEKAQLLIDTFLGMIKREITEEEQLEILDEAVALQNISNMPARVKCAVLSWHTLESAITTEEGKTSESSQSSH
ncbi:Fe-S cluster assembly sulfur transfer protein SufU [Pelosinus fermentans]|uniref:SUF system FeS assembly protein, NifU family n=1 Tax=Pelosinus fermentans JBW45 TaxID=1192197 RepID=I9DG60_9FIRM|nr:SUF system NifU family Fe-S cluster assembly protein [Pelosinus fermentans]AJQ26702.1 SUF system FeS assembly protein, NifU family [Pelosinus fermentans JBW45]